jgi:peptidoglycan/LPS O-acetylase OafA/YrhL
MQTRFDQRGNNFDFIRLFLAVLVIFSHSYPLSSGSEFFEPFNLLTHHQVTGGGIAVDLFFVISGFLITASFERSSSIAGYLKKRVFRIYPGFVVAMILELLIVLPASGGHMAAQSSFARATDVVVQTLRLQEFHYSGAFAGLPYPGALNGSTWSIQYEFWCYIGVIVLGMVGALRSNKTLLAFFFTTLVVSYLFAVYGWKPGGKWLGVVFGYPPFWARLLPMYTVGIVFYRLRSHLLIRTSWIVAGIGLLIAGAIIPDGWPIFFPVAGAYLVLALAFHPMIRLHNWSRYGDFSYGTYLYAFPVQQLIMRSIGHPTSPWKLFLLAAPLTILCAAVSWHLVERWFLPRASKAKPLLNPGSPAEYRSA